MLRESSKHVQKSEKYKSNISVCVFSVTFLTHGTFAYIWRKSNIETQKSREKNKWNLLSVST